LIFDGDEEDRLVGFAAWQVLDERSAIQGRRVGEIRFIGVVPDRQREGIGRRLLEHCLDEIYSALGSEDVVVRAEVDPNNFNALNALELGWGFESYPDLPSALTMLILRPDVTSEGDADGAEPEA
jgi:ribosomal protein S18 acetylase RimI-like enzyme